MNHLNIYTLIACGVAAWHIAWAATPIQIIKNAILPAYGFLRELFDCPTCVGFWIGFTVSILSGNLQMCVADALMVSIIATTIGKIDKLTSTIN